MAANDRMITPDPERPLVKKLNAAAIKLKSSHVAMQAKQEKVAAIKRILMLLAFFLLCVTITNALRCRSKQPIAMSGFQVLAFTAPAASAIPHYTSFAPS
ncbi:hypothetical protein FEM33_17735 [Dyadobacter flavalbus]|uniref:Uncharacterized protein n=1 Tax=Dyadobacter flavalbus TaxID=2579942 RepID=A0A5M8QV61_9BACT|nr:hypothetical protein [Dyadobacter flavalbus]KAA6438526.1 hypothetical protein FEM33_17735 [Dyadobacter flavalbus]